MQNCRENLVFNPGDYIFQENFSVFTNPPSDGVMNRLPVISQLAEFNPLNSIIPDCVDLLLYPLFKETSSRFPQILKFVSCENRTCLCRVNDSRVVSRIDKVDGYSWGDIWAALRSLFYSADFKDDLYPDHHYAIGRLVIHSNAKNLYLPSFVISTTFVNESPFLEDIWLPVADWTALYARTELLQMQGYLRESLAACTAFDNTDEILHLPSWSDPQAAMFVGKSDFEFLCDMMMSDLSLIIYPLQKLRTTCLNSVYPVNVRVLDFDRYEVRKYNGEVLFARNFSAGLCLNLQDWLGEIGEQVFYRQGIYGSSDILVAVMGPDGLYGVAAFDYKNLRPFMTCQNILPASAYAYFVEAVNSVESQNDKSEEKSTSFAW